MPLVESLNIIVVQYQMYTTLLVTVSVSLSLFFQHFDAMQYELDTVWTMVSISTMPPPQKCSDFQNCHHLISSFHLYRSSVTIFMWPWHGFGFILIFCVLFRRNFHFSIHSRCSPHSPSSSLAFDIAGHTILLLLCSNISLGQQIFVLSSILHSLSRCLVACLFSCFSFFLSSEFCM